MKKKVKNISFKEFVNLSFEELQKYRFYLQYGNFKPVDLFGFGEITEQTFGFVKELQNIMTDGMDFKKCIEFISEKTELNLEDIADTGIFDLQQQRIWFRDAIQKINEIENSALQSGLSAIEEAAGINVFAEYRSFLQYDTLTGGNLLNFAEVEKLPYLLCLTKLKLNKDMSEYQQRLHNLTMKK